MTTQRWTVGAALAALALGGCARSLGSSSEPDPVAQPATADRANEPGVVDRPGLPSEPSINLERWTGEKILGPGKMPDPSL